MQTKKPLIISIIIALIVVVGVVSVLSSNQEGKQNQYTNEYDQYGSTSTEAALKVQDEINIQIKGGVATTDNQATSTIQVNTFTLADIATHATDTDCWTTINGGVYNLTQFIAEHPGGKRGIMSICGKDGSEAFREEHGKGGRAQAAVFAKYKVGILK